MPDREGPKENVIEVSVCEVSMPAILDSGADISILPEEVVPTAARLNETVSVVSYDGRQKVRESAEGNIRMGEDVLRERVALASMEESDNGTQFMGKLVKEQGELLGIDLVKMTPYHPQANGVVENALHSGEYA